MSLNYKCPVCKNRLYVVDKSYICRNKHTFDVSKEGYVNFALGKFDSGDSAKMCISRRNFLSKGYYENFANLICQTIKKHILPQSVVDAGCGEGYYLRKIREKFPDANLFGVDLAKEAIKLAAKSEKNSQLKKNEYSVCGIFSLPFFDEEIDAVLSVFAPVGENENHRILKKDGYMFVAGPGKMHLSGLKEAIYDVPYENEEKIKDYNGFKFIEKNTCEYSVVVSGEDILDLFTMTPYYWKTSKEDMAKLLNIKHLATDLSFEVSVYKKI